MLEEDFKITVMASLARIEQKADSMVMVVADHIRAEEIQWVASRTAEDSKVSYSVFFTFMTVIATLFTGAGAAIVSLLHIH